jgi:hypothetical protein
VQLPSPVTERDEILTSLSFAESIILKRFPAAPRESRTVSTKDNIPQTLAPIPYGEYILHNQSLSLPPPPSLALVRFNTHAYPLCRHHHLREWIRLTWDRTACFLWDAIFEIELLLPTDDRGRESRI